MFHKEKASGTASSFMFCWIYIISPGNRLLLLVAGAAAGGWKHERKMVESFSNDKTRQSLSISTTSYIKIIKCSGASSSLRENCFSVIWKDKSERSFEIIQGCRGGRNVPSRRILLIWRSQDRNVTRRSWKIIRFWIVAQYVSIKEEEMISTK